MFGSRGGRQSSVTCVGCGESLRRRDAREYDKHGDRWDREDKTFEYLCKPCHRDLCHQPRRGLESTLVECGAGECDQQTFVGRFLASTGALEEPER